jgi:WG containing repeat
MKPSSFVALFCSLAINGFNAIHQPAAAESLPHGWNAIEVLSLTNSATAETDKGAVTQVGEKYGYKSATGRMTIEVRFNDADEFFDGLAAVQIGKK